MGVGFNMANEAQEVREVVKGYILNEFLPGEPAESLSDETPLIKGGILDSISTVKMVTFLEERFKVEFESPELGEEHLDTVNLIVELIESKK